jgi:hypothetical protein
MSNYSYLVVILFMFRPSNVLTILKLKGKKSVGLSSTNGNASPRFSEIVSGGGAGNVTSGGKKLGVTGVQKKLQQKMNKTHQPTANNKQGAGDFKIGQVFPGFPTFAFLSVYMRQLSACTSFRILGFMSPWFFSYLCPLKL